MKDDTYRICIVCEGEEEFDYLSRLNELGVWSSKYIITLINAASLTSIPARYQWAYNSDNYDIVFAFCDTELEPYEQFSLVKEKIKKLFGNRKAAENVIFFANPCTMQIMLLHFDFVELTSNSKVINKHLIEKYTGVKEYRAREKQREDFMKFITAENYKAMKENIAMLESDPTKINSTNFLQLLNYLESDDTKWVKALKKKLNE